MDSRPILVAGGGIGGLAAALALARAGHAVTVLERAATLGEVGAGIQLGPNAFHALDALGLGPTAREGAVYIDRLQLMDATSGKAITHIDLGEPFRTAFGNPYAVIHRGDLHAALLDACRASGIVLRTSAAVAAYEQDGAAVTARLDDGERVVGQALIGADGLRSAVRRQLAGNTPLCVPGHTTYRSVIPTERMPETLRWNAATLWAAPRCHLVHYPLQGWRVFNLAITCHNGVTEPHAARPVATEHVLAEFAHVHPRAQDIIRHGRDWKSWVLADREPIARWVDGRVALLGDAAHPMLQYFAQGACMALEDAVALGTAFAATGSVEEALETYQAARLLRTARVQLMSRLLGEHVYHAEGVNAALRDATMRAKSAEDWHVATAWLYGHGRAAA